MSRTRRMDCSHLRHEENGSNRREHYGKSYREGNLYGTLVELNSVLTTVLL